MRKTLIAALGLVSLVSLANAADPRDPKNIGAKLTPEHLKSLCASHGGSFTQESSGTGLCKFKDGKTWECNVNSVCMGWKGSY